MSETTSPRQRALRLAASCATAALTLAAVLLAAGCGGSRHAAAPTTTSAPRACPLSAAQRRDVAKAKREIVLMHRLEEPLKTVHPTGPTAARERSQPLPPRRRPTATRHQRPAHGQGKGRERALPGLLQRDRSRRAGRADPTRPATLCGPIASRRTVNRSRNGKTRRLARAWCRGSFRNTGPGELASLSWRAAYGYQGSAVLVTRYLQRRSTNPGCPAGVTLRSR